VAKQWTDEVGGRDRALRKETVHFARGLGRLEEEDDHRTVDPGPIQMNVGLEDSREVRHAQPIAESLPIVAEPEGGQPGSE